MQSSRGARGAHAWAQILQSSRGARVGSIFASLPARTRGLEFCKAPGAHAWARILPNCQIARGGSDSAKFPDRTRWFRFCKVPKARAAAPILQKIPERTRWIECCKVPRAHAVARILQSSLRALGGSNFAKLRRAPTTAKNTSGNGPSPVNAFLVPGVSQPSHMPTLYAPESPTARLAATAFKLPGWPGRVSALAYIPHSPRLHRRPQHGHRTGKAVAWICSGCTKKTAA